MGVKMELQKREKEMLELYTFISGLLSKSERIKERKTINKDLSYLLEEGELSKEEYDETLKELDEIDKLP